MHAMRATMAARLNTLANSAHLELSTLARPVFPESVPAEDRLGSLAMLERPMVRAGVEEVRAANAAATLARREIIPDLQVGVQYGQRSATMARTNSAGELMIDRNTERMGSLMIGASIPIFARDRQLKMRDEANAMKAMAEADLAAMRADTRGRVAEVYASLTRARNLTRLYRFTVLPQAQATVASALSSYRVGRVDFMTLLDDQMTVNRYRLELFAIEADEGKAWADLEMLIGRELIDSNSTAELSNDTASKSANRTAADSANRGGK